MSSGDPVEAMARRLIGSARQCGVPADGQSQIEAAFRAASATRGNVDQHDPALLHPARTVLILINDAHVAAADTLTAAALAESEDRHLVVPIEQIKQDFNARVAELVEAIPDPAQSGDELLETLLAADPDAQLIAVAERLDHARHLHLKPTTLWADHHDIVRRAYLPVAERIDATLGRRLRWWCSMFERQYLKR
ncbi:MAG: hypothetical protein ACREMA_04970 [Longimicrobiales bacterium]